MVYSLITGMYEAPGTMVLGLLVVSIWALIWKGLGLWYAGKNQQKGWFIAMLILNTLGLLPIVYLIWFKPKCESCQEELKEETKPKKVTKKVVKKISKGKNKK